jgi:hydrogenase maturation factor
VTYWHRPHTSKTRLPVLFIHGIGVGLYPYTNFLAELSAQDGDKDLVDGQTGIIAIELMSISSHLTVDTLLKNDICEEIELILEAYNWGKFVLVSHS